MIIARGMLSALLITRGFSGDERFLVKLVREVRKLKSFLFRKIILRSKIWR
jgi:hypothetical protein